MSARSKLKRVLYVYAIVAVVINIAFKILPEAFLGLGYFLEDTPFAFTPGLLIAGPTLGFFFPFGMLGFAIAVVIGLIGGVVSSVLISMPWLVRRWWSYGLSVVGVLLWLIQGIIMTGVMY